MSPAAADRCRIAVMLAPAVVGIGGLFLGGLALAVLGSIGVNLWDVAPGGPTLAPYARALDEPGLAASALLTIQVAVLATLIATVVGTAAAILVRRVGRRFGAGTVVALLFQANLTVPHVVAAVGTGLLVAQSGLIARLAHAAGLIGGPSDMPALTHDPHGLGILLSYVWKEIPFVGAVVLAQLAVVGDGPAAVARTLGASRWQAFRHVTLPLIRPAVTAAGALVFAFTLGAYEVPAVLGASHPKLLPVLAYDLFTSNDLADRPAAVALSLMTAVAALLAVGAYRRLALVRSP